MTPLTYMRELAELRQRVAVLTAELRRIEGMLATAGFGNAGYARPAADGLRALIEDREALLELYNIERKRNVNHEEDSNEHA